MRTLEEHRLVELQFRKLVSEALEERWRKDGRYSAKDILADLQNHEEVWKAMAAQLAQRAAVVAIRRQMAARDPGIDPAQEKFQFAKELPVSSITYKGSVVSTLRSTADEYIWFSNWYERRHTGTVKRSKFDKKTLAKIKRLARIVEKYRGDGSEVTVRSVFQARQDRLDALRKQRRNRKRADR
jgi:hypothetical protein